MWCGTGLALTSDMRYKMTTKATEADLIKTKNAQIEEHPPAPVFELRKNQAKHFDLLSTALKKEQHTTPPTNAVSALNFEMKPMRFENDSGIQHDSHVLVFASDMEKRLAFIL